MVETIKRWKNCQFLILIKNIIKKSLEHFNDFSNSILAIKIQFENSKSKTKKIISNFSFPSLNTFLFSLVLFSSCLKRL